VTDAERLEEIPLSQIQEWHKEGRRGDGSPSYCVACKQGWPCDTVLALAEVERLRETETSLRIVVNGLTDTCDLRAAAMEGLRAEVERLRGVARRAYDAFSLSAQYTDQERFLAMKALGLALGLFDPDALAGLEAKP